MDKDTITEVRRKLKKQLYRERAEWTKNGYQPLCAICGEPPKDGRALQMHEALITRGDVMYNTELGYDIMTRYNCVLVHADCHEYANTDEGKFKCAQNIYKYEDYQKIYKWLNCMSARMSSTTAEEAKRLLLLVKRDAQNTKQPLRERKPMKCKVCGKDIFQHSEKEVNECLKDAGISTRGENPLSLLTKLKVKVTFNHRHGWIRYPGGQIDNSKDVDLDLFRLCLTSDEIKAPKKEEKEDDSD